MIQKRVCQEPSCQREFIGGPRAYYCPSCRQIRTKATSAVYRQRKRQCSVRPLGSKDKCERCSNPYIVEGGNQRFCPECRPIHTLEYDRETSLPFYHANKQRINPIRYQRRKVGMRPCFCCGMLYLKSNRSTTCSDACKRKLINRKYNAVYGPAYRARKRDARK